MENRRSKKYQVLNGDSLAYSFPQSNIEGEIVVIREGLIDGDLKGDSVQDFWLSRAKYQGISIDEYKGRIVSEFEKIENAPEDSVFNLWFEYDLFCQVNMWFVISYIKRLSKRNGVFAVYSSHLKESDKNFWNGFGRANSDELKFCFANRIQLKDSDLQLGKDLWNAYKDQNLQELSRLSKNQSRAFPYLEEIVKANTDRYPQDGSPGRPEKTIKDIIENVSADFHEVFREFWKRESIYGFGDTQVKHLYDKLIKSRNENRNL